MDEVLDIIALIAVPIIAVIVGQKLQDRAQKRNDKMQIFKIYSHIFVIKIHKLLIKSGGSRENIVIIYKLIKMH